MKENLDYDVLFDYLRNNLSTRAICKKYPKINDKTGFKSHDILKKYNLGPKYKGALFLLSKRDAKKFVLQVLDKNIAEILINGNNIPNWLKNKYQNSKILAKDSNAAHNCIDGELRNNILRLFKPRRKEAKYCQYTDCRNTDLEAAHKRNFERKKAFIQSAKKFMVKNENYFTFPIYEIMTDFLLSHRNNKIFFLCKKHHNKYDKIKDYVKFEKEINK